ncbi:hypothetical protein NIASO_00025 [Niabella soli DSM 19437]|uniref:Uncharacterized protein n=1 Tax=Niabella soli DSM 19437 TaxID=929713 RepID=W0F6K8_9BACT|nr:hypothetical protein NIASO_00025 [Niabella soli DSM 19437]
MAGRRHNQACSEELTGSAPAWLQNRGAEFTFRRKKIFCLLFYRLKKVREETKQNEIINRNEKIVSTSFFAKNVINNECSPL